MVNCRSWQQLHVVLIHIFMNPSENNETERIKCADGTAGIMWERVALSKDWMRVVLIFLLHHYNCICLLFSPLWIPTLALRLAFPALSFNFVCLMAMISLGHVRLCPLMLWCSHHLCLFSHSHFIIAWLSFIETLTGSIIEFISVTVKHHVKGTHVARTECVFVCVCIYTSLDCKMCLSYKVSRKVKSMAALIINK